MRYKTVLKNGDKYGLLTVLGYYGHIDQRPAYVFKCDCGEVKCIQARFVASGRTKSCGCLRYMIASAHTGIEYKNYVGKKFDRLLVLEYNYDHIGNGAHLLCQCDCGNEKVICARHLMTGQVKSCGCKLRELQGKKCV